jgi:hypothetical protein
VVTNIGDTQPVPVSAVHLDAVGGIAGDMFSAALLDIRPDLWPMCEHAISAVGLPAGAGASLAPHGDGVLRGSRFNVMVPEGADADHVRWPDLRERLSAASLEEHARAAALGIFGALAEAEAAVHGIEASQVTFHEVGAHDSIADILSAAAIISALAPCAWSIGPIPRGRGSITTDHGRLPVPAPATLELLKGFVLIDDGEDGERVTPTGAAIVRYLAPSQDADTIPRRLIGAGTGFGNRTLKSRSNVLRATLFAEIESAMEHDRVEVLRFEVDDQTSEDLAAALDHLRAAQDVIDVCQWPVLGKKGRLAAAVQVLVKPGAGERVVRDVFFETTTLGVRHGTVTRTMVTRRMEDVDGAPVKLARRPSRVSAKMEMDALSPIKGRVARQTVRRKTETEAMKREKADG